MLFSFFEGYCAIKQTFLSLFLPFFSLCPPSVFVACADLRYFVLCVFDCCLVLLQHRSPIPAERQSSLPVLRVEECFPTLQRGQIRAAAVLPFGRRRAAEPVDGCARTVAHLPTPLLARDGLVSRAYTAARATIFPHAFHRLVSPFCTKPQCEHHAQRARHRILCRCQCRYTLPLPAQTIHLARWKRSAIHVVIALILCACSPTIRKSSCC